MWIAGPPNAHLEPRCLGAVVGVLLLRLWWCLINPLVLWFLLLVGYFVLILLLLLVRIDLYLSVIVGRVCFGGIVDLVFLVERDLYSSLRDCLGLETERWDRGFERMGRRVWRFAMCRCSRG